jgi:4-amino-4-deoxy-L-arabinose transferase-like glycosyltransferase
LTSVVVIKTESITPTAEVSKPKEKPGRDLLACGALLVLCFFLYFNGLGEFPFIDPSEAYYVEACREMLQTGDYITPHLNYQIYFSKPIINFWLIAASYKMFGLSEFTARLPFAILSSGLVLATYFFARKIFTARAGFIAAFCLATSPLLILVSRKSSIDIAFTFFLNLAVFATAYTFAKRNKWSWVAIYVALGLGVLTKGPATIILYGAGMAAFLVVARPSIANLKDWMGRLKLPIGLGVFLAVVLPWHLAVSSATDGLFLKVFFWYENLARFQGHTNFGTVRYWFYLSVLGYGFFPWVAILPAAITYALLGEKKQNIETNQTANISDRNANDSDNANGSDRNAALDRSVTSDRKVSASERRLDRNDTSSRNVASDRNIVSQLFHGTIENIGRVRERAANDDQARVLILLTAWSLTTLAFFSVSKTQLATYILPMIAPIAVLTGVLADRWIARGYERLTRGARFWSNLFSWLFAIAGVAAAIGSLVFAYMCSDTSPAILAYAVMAGLVFAIGGLTQLEAIRSRRLELSSKWIAGTIALTMGLGTPPCFNFAVDKLQGNLKTISTNAGKSSDKIAMYGNFMPSSMFYAKKPVDTFFHGHQLIPVATPQPGKEGVYPNVPQAILVRDSEFVALRDSAPCALQLVEKQGNWGWYRTPGYELESVKTLEDTFRDPVAFKIIVNGESPTGPLTVPYAAGKLYERYAE